MKRLLLLGASFAFAASSFAQLSWGTKIGQTYYDLQSNSSVGHRLVRNADGTLSATWIEHWDFLVAGTPDEPRGVRGFGYNHFDPASGWVYGVDGECWEVDNGCASSYIGWPEIVNIPSNGGDDEMVFSHLNGQGASGTPGISFTSRADIGTGTWSNTSTLHIDTLYDVNAMANDLGGTWPRMIASGNTIHGVACFANTGPNATTAVRDVNGIESPIRYYRSTDGGQTFDIKNYALPIDSTDLSFVGGDAYAIHANGNNVAITLGSGIDNDWLLLKSTDNGDTWTKILIADNHNITDTAFINPDSSVGVPVNDDAFSIVVDDNGVAHCFATMILAEPEEGGQYILNDSSGARLYYESDAAILYWKEGMAGPIKVAYPDYGYDTNPNDYSVPGGYRYGGFYQSYPTASFDASGNLFLIYSAIAEGTEFVNSTTNDIVGYNDLYMVYSLDNGATWCQTNDPINIAEDVFGQLGATPTQDDVFPSAVPKIGTDNIMHFTWQGDYNRPGLALVEDTHPNNEIQYIHYAGVDISALTGCNQVPIAVNSIADVKEKINFSILPNPAKEIANISADATINTVSLVNVYGQVVKTELVNAVNEYTLNVADVAPGMYVVRVETNEGTATQKLNIVK